MTVESGSSATLEIDRRRNLSVEEFIERYSRPRKPVIIEDAAENWAALGKWTPSYLSEALAGVHVPYRFDGGQQEPFDVLMERVVASTPEEPGPYLQNINIERATPVLWPDVTPRLPWATPNWKDSRLVRSDLYVPNAMEALFIGGAGVGLSTLHIDYYGLDAFLTQIYGPKDFVVHPPTDVPHLSIQSDGLLSAIDDPFDPDLDRFPDVAKTNPVQFTLQPGESLFSPNGWLHATRITEPSITVITQQWNRDSWGGLARHAWKTALRKPVPSRLIDAARVSVAGPVLGARERMGRG